MIANAKQMSNRESLIRKLEKQAAHDAVHFSPPFQLSSDFAESDSIGGDCTFMPHDLQLASIPVAATKKTPTANPSPPPTSAVMLRRNSRRANHSTQLPDSKNWWPGRSMAMPTP